MHYSYSYIHLSEILLILLQNFLGVVKTRPKYLSGKESHWTFWAALYSSLYSVPSLLWLWLSSHHIENIFYFSHLSEPIIMLLIKVSTQHNEEWIIQTKPHSGYFSHMSASSFLYPQQLGDVYDYEVLLDYQVNLYVAPDGSKPFQQAPDSQTATCSWRPVCSIASK